MKPLHIGIVCEEFPPAPHGGTGSSYFDLTNGLIEAGHKVTVVGPYYKSVVDALPPERKVANLNVVRLLRLPMWVPFRLWMIGNRLRIKNWLKQEHRRNPFDIIETSDYGGWLSYGGPAGVPTITKMRGSNIFFDHELKRSGSAVEHNLEKQCLARAHFLGAVSRYAANRTLEICGLSHRQSTVIYNAVDTELFSPSPDVKPERGLITFINSISPKKGIEQLIDAMEIVWKQEPCAQLAVIGQDTAKSENGKTYIDRLKERIRPEHRQAVIFVGRQDRRKGVIDYLRRAEVCCYPSHMETFGIAVIEAMSVGKPTIFSKIGPGPEVLEHGVSGLLCDPTNPADIADNILKNMKQPELAARLSANARARVLKDFDKRNWVPRNVEFFRDCIARFGKG